MSITTNNPLHELLAVEIDARDYGFEWPNAQMVIEQAISECEEIRSAINDSEPAHRIQEEIGDLLHTAISLCMFCGYDVEQTLDNATQKFAGRMQALKQAATRRGLKTFKGQTTDFMMELWREIKLLEKG